ncbi:MAG: hypothetical protein HFH08_02480 [Bacilli bacterium]|nr:hypothetical protein [Bacilli bacterium]
MKGVTLHLAPGLFVVDEVNRLSKDSAGTVTDLCIRKNDCEKTKSRL